VLKDPSVDLVDGPFLLPKQERQILNKGLSGTGMNFTTNASGHLLCPHHQKKY
jgi:hypothetical protein